MRARLVAGGAYLAVGLYFLSLVVFAHRSQWLWLGLLWLGGSALQFALGIARRRRERPRPDPDAR